MELKKTGVDENAPDVRASALAEAEELEARIDEMVYALYDLTQEEINIVKKLEKEIVPLAA